MAGFSVEVPHNLGQQGAIDRLNALMEKMRDEYEDQVSDLEGTWTDNRLDYSFGTFGLNIEGSMTVNEKSVVVEGKLPFAAMMFRGQIEKQLKGELEKALA